MVNRMEEKDYNKIGKLLSGEEKATTSDADLSAMKSIWDSAGSYNYPELSNSDAAWTDLQKRISTPAPIKISWIRQHAFAVAASIALLAVAGTSFWMMNNSPDKNSIAAIHEKTGNKEIKTVSLSDGSVVVLNSNSEVTVVAGFNETNRTIELKGEANFEVAPNKDIPFVVTAGKTITQVVGTGFDISAFEGEDVKITVTHGKVKFAGTKDNVMLVKGDAAKYDARASKVQKVEADLVNLAWQNENWIFKAAKLNDIALQIKHRFGKTMKFEATNASKLFTGKFATGTSPEQMAKTISQALQISVTID